MDEANVTPGERAAGVSGLGDLVYEGAHSYGRAQVFSVKDAGGRWQRLTAGEFATEVTAVAKGLIAAGVGEGDRVVLAVGSRHEWVLLGFAVWAVRAVVVPVAPVSCAERLRHVLRDARPAAVVLEDGRHAGTVAGLQRELTDLGRVWRLDQAALSEIAKLGAYMDASAIRFRRESAVREDAAAVLYPMSTASRRMRGVVLSHAGVLAAAAGVADRMWPRVAELEEGAASTLMDLPLSEISGLSAVVACVLARVRVGFVPAGGRLAAEVRSFRPTVLVCSARLLEQVHERERERARAAGWDALGSFNAATEVAVEFDKAPKKGAWRRLSRSMYEWMFTRVREALGGRVYVVVCWGGGLSEEMDHFYGGVGVPVMQVFGTAEAGGVFAANAVGERRAGTVGRPVEGVEVWPGRGGELYVRGGGVFAGYWEDAQASAAAFVDGWLATGVAGEVDESGFVRVRGRVRAQAVAPPGAGRAVEASSGQTGGVQPVAGPAVGEEPVRADPAVRGEEAPAGEDAGDDARMVAGLEARLRAHPLISQVLVIVEGRPFASALITLVRDQLEYWRLVNGRPLSMAPEEIAGDRDLLREVQGLVYEANRSVPRRLAVRSFHVLAEEFTVQSGLVHPSGELRRDAVLRAFAEEIDGLYRVREG